MMFEICHYILKKKRPHYKRQTLNFMNRVNLRKRKLKGYEQIKSDATKSQF